jgi:hypothetical protein
MEKYKLIGYDFEVFSKAKWWCVTFVFYDTKEIITIINNKDELRSFYDKYRDCIFIGYNNRNYDSVIMKSILLGKDVFKMSDDLIFSGKKPYQLLRGAKHIQFYNYDVSNKLHSLKQLEAFMGSRIKETDVSFDLDRPLTNEEVRQVIEYNIHDVLETLKVFDYKKETFDSKLLLIETFELGMEHFERTDAQLCGIILKAVKQPIIPDELDFRLTETLKLNKYKYVYDWYMNPRNRTTDRKLEVCIAENNTTFAWGGVHGAKNNIVREGYVIAFDVKSLYPSLMILFNLVSRNVPNPKAYEDIRDKRFELQKIKDERQKALKLFLNSTYGATNDINNILNDPNSANSVCINGQLLLLDLVEKVEHLGEVLQINTDGIYMYLGEFGEESDIKLNNIKELAKEWEIRTGLQLEWDIYSKLFQRDVNNYIIVEPNGKYKSKGEVKKRSPVDNDLPIVSEALVDYCVKGTPIEKTINDCDDLIKFQKVVKLTRDYPYALHGEERLSEKVFRVFASNSENIRGIFKVKKDNSVAKFGSTPNNCFIWNDEVTNIKCPKELDKQWYIDRANEKLKDFLQVDSVETKQTDQEILLDCLKQNHNSIFELMCCIKENTKLTKLSLSKFIKIGAFSKYMKSKSALLYMEAFMNLYAKNGKGGKYKTFSKLLNFESLELLKLHSDYKEDKEAFANINFSEFMIDLESKIDNQELDIIDKLRCEFDMYDECSLIDDSVDKLLVFIMNVNDTKIPSVVAYSIKTGTYNFLKVSKESFGILEIKKGDVIQIKKVTKKGKPIVLDKDLEGINIIGESKDSYEWWIEGYEIVSRDYGKNKTLSEVGYDI